MNKNQVEKVIWWAYIILLFAIVVRFKGSFAELRDRITSYSSQEAVVFNVIPFRNIGVQISHITQWWALKKSFWEICCHLFLLVFFLPIAYPRIKAFFSKHFFSRNVCSIVYRNLSVYDTIGKF